MKNKEIKCIILDAGRVLNDYDFKIFVRSITPHSPFNEEGVYNVLYVLVKKCILGKLTTKEFYNEAAKKLKVKDLSFNKFKESWKNVIFTTNDPIEEVLINIRPEINKVLLSNIAEFNWSERLSKTSLVKKYFPKEKQRILSFRFGIAKPDEEIYRIALSVYKNNAQEAILIDDKERNLDGFKKIGGNIIHYDCRIHTIEELKKELEKYSVLIH